MKARIFLLIIAAALVALGLGSISRRGSPRRTPPPAAKNEVPIQDGKTIDFSSGKAEVKDDAANTAALERSVTAMDNAAAAVTFAPKATTTTGTAGTGTAAPAKTR